MIQSDKFGIDGKGSSAAGRVHAHFYLGQPVAVIRRNQFRRHCLVSQTAHKRLRLASRKHPPPRYPRATAWVAYYSRSAVCAWVSSVTPCHQGNWAAAFCAKHDRTVSRGLTTKPTRAPWSQTSLGASNDSAQCHNSLVVRSLFVFLVSFVVNPSVFTLLPPILFLNRQSPIANSAIENRPSCPTASADSRPVRRGGGRARAG